MKVIFPILFAASVFFCLSASALTTSDYYDRQRIRRQFLAAANRAPSRYALPHYVNVQKAEVVTLTDGDTMITWQFGADGVTRLSLFFSHEQVEAAVAFRG